MLSTHRLMSVVGVDTRGAIFQKVFTFLLRRRVVFHSLVQFTFLLFCISFSPVTLPFNALSSSWQNPFRRYTMGKFFWTWNIIWLLFFGHKICRGFAPRHIPYYYSFHTKLATLLLCFLFAFRISSFPSRVELQKRENFGDHMQCTHAVLCMYSKLNQAWRGES